MLFRKELKISPTKKRQLSFDKILEGVKSSTLYSFLVVDIHTPDRWKEKFKDLPPIIKNTLISQDDIGDYMKNVAKNHNLFKKPRKYLNSSYFAKEILINTVIAKFYLKMGLEITRIKEFIELHPQKCFSKLANEIVDSKMAADADFQKLSLL